MIWNARSLLRQVELGEDSRLEFKEAFFKEGRLHAPSREVVADELAAFANFAGGTLVFSVSDRGDASLLEYQPPPPPPTPPGRAPTGTASGPPRASP